MRQGWHCEDIKAAIRKRGTSLCGLARDAGLAPGTMSRSLRVRFPTYHTVIAEYLDIPVQELWPHWYDDSGRPLGRTRPDARSRRSLLRIAGE